MTTAPLLWKPTTIVAVVVVFTTALLSNVVDGAVNDTAAALKTDTTSEITTRLRSSPDGFLLETTPRSSVFRNYDDYGGGDDGDDDDNVADDGRKSTPLDTVPSTVSNLEKLNETVRELLLHPKSSPTLVFICKFIRPPVQ